MRRADTHQVAGLVLRQNLIDHLNHLIHHLRRFTNGQSANGITVSSLVGHVLGSFAAQVLISTALYDGEQRLLIAVERFCLIEPLDATVKPALGQPQRLLGILVVALSWRTFVKGHHDVGANDALSIHHVLRGEDMLGTVDVATEFASFLAELADACQGKYLKTAGVSQYRTVPGIELMKTACLAKCVKSGAQIKMVGVAQDNLGLDLLTEFSEVNTLDRANRSYGHEDRGLDLSVVGGYQACTCIAAWVGMLYFELHFFFSSSSGISNFVGLTTISLVSAKFHTSCTFST